MQMKYRPSHQHKASKDSPGSAGVPPATGRRPVTVMAGGMPACLGFISGAV